MVNHISISNFAIIKNTEIDFEEGLNIITGETGAGKSIIIEAISLALGSRADSSLVRHGANKAMVQLAGDLDGEEIIITREVSATGKNLCKLNGELVTLGQLQSACKRIADIHGQYDNQSLLNTDNHILLVDKFHADSISPVKTSFDTAYKSYHEIKRKLDNLLKLEGENKRKADFYRFEKSEIDHANLKPGEDDALSEEVSLLQNSEKIYAGLEGAYEHLYAGDINGMTGLGAGLAALEGISEYSKEISSLTEDFKDAYYKLEDITSSLREIKDKISFDPVELDNAISRLDKIDTLKKKYGHTIEEILEYRDKISEELNSIENFDEVKNELEDQCLKSYESLKSLAENLTKVRQESALKLSKAIEKELHQLNFNDAKLSINFSLLPEIGALGQDIVEIYIATNKGEPLKPLVKVASGGEISRIMLAIKNITGTYDNIPTMIFDEIDAGISGITASVVGRKLKDISKSHQIICITHLPQIASCANVNFRIHKESDNESTFTYVEKLAESEVVEEIARLLGGDNITETTRKSARELIESSR